MIIKIYWNNSDSQKLFDTTNEVLNELWLNEFIKLEQTHDLIYKEELGITQEPAFCIEEESIEFKDIIFEWFVPEKDEVTSMIMSIIWWEDGWCSSWCDSCSTWCH